MRRYRVKGRFYVFLLIILLIVFLIVRPHIRFGEDVEVISLASSAYTHDMNAVLIRDEQLVTSQSVARIEYVAFENTLVSKGDTVAYLYSSGYSESELSKLETTRENIQAYHKTMLENIIDNNLERLEAMVDQRAMEFKNLVTHKNKGNLVTINRLLETAMVNRQEYMRSNMRNDLKLNNLYAQENARLNSIASWRVESTAENDGVVSFYTDGYEQYLNANTIADLDADDINAVMTGRAMGESSVRQKDVYRLVNQDLWYVAIIADASEWNPVLDQEYYMQFEGFDDLGFNARVKSVSQSGKNVLAVFEIASPMGPLIYQRTARASVSITLTGMSVSTGAIYQENGQTGVWLYDVPGGTFVPVTVLSTSGDMAIIEPVVEGAIQTGNRVLIK
jgi:putative membrane fusion protein